MNQLIHKIKKTIKKLKYIDVYQYINMVLYDSVNGYYLTKNVIGKNGDYITSPEITQVFGEVLACWFINYWNQYSTSKKINLIELGPGKGTLMKDMLNVFKCHNSFWNNLNNVVLVEISPILKKTQQEKLKLYKEKILHLDSLKKFTQNSSEVSFIVANEFFDALPIQQFIRTNTTKRKRKITLNENNQIVLEKLNQNSYIEEYCPHYKENILNICNLIKQGESCLIIDYGFEENSHKMCDSLQGIKNHQYHDILNKPGDVDLSHHVNFQKLRGLIPSNMKTVLSTQGSFLVNNGIVERTERLASQIHDTHKKNNLLSATARLIMPQHMGNLFKVLQILG